MKKIIYAFLSCCVCQNAFADSPSGVYQNQHVNSILIPRIILQNVLIQDDLISQTPGAVEKMMAKYDQLAGPLGQEPLTVNDITQICASSDVITKKDDCLNHVFNPVLAQMGKVRFMNACSGRITGGNPHCVDDVFVEGKKQNANQYHQDVNVGPYAANGFAIEYAKKKGHDVWCSSEVKDGTVNCTTLDNKEFYSVKFKGTNNTTDTTIEKNLVKGICALFDSKYAIGTFRHQCKMDCAPGSKAREVIQKFGLNVHDGYTKDMHCEIYQPTYTAKDVKTYPGYEYMSRTFKNVQSVLDSSLVEVLKTYVQLQGINVQSFDCEFSPRKYSDEMSNGIPASLDDMLRCHLNGTDVDFIFDDLFEGKEYERKAGQAALQCVLAGGSYGTDRICSGLGKAKCLSPEVQSMIPGGTRWDSKAEVCLLNRAENARTISNALQVGGGIALAIVFTPTGMPFVGLAAVGASVALDAAFIGVERLNILEPASRARQFATDAQKCEIPIGSKHPSCSQQQVDCAWRVVNQHFARLDEVLDRLNPDQLSLVSDLMENTTDCLSNDLLSSAVKMSTPNAWDKALNKANAFLLVAGIFIQPEKGVMRITENAPKVARILSRCKMVESVSTRLDNTRYLRIYVDNIGQDDIRALATDFRNNGAYVSTKLYKAEDGTHFMAVAEKDIFSKLEGLSSTVLERWDDYGKGFLKRFNYNVDARAATWEDVLLKWGLPKDATDDIIEARYKAMMEDLRLYDTKGDAYLVSNQGDLIGSVQTDYQIIKRTKPNFGKVNAVVDNSFAFRKANGVFADISDEAGRIRIQAMKDKYGIKFQDGSVGIRLPDGIDDIMRQELGKSPIEMRFYDDVRDFMRGYHGIDIGDFDNVAKTAPVATPATPTKPTNNPFMPKQTTGPTVSTKPTATPENPTKGKFDFNMGKPDNTVSAKPQELPTQTVKPTTETPTSTRAEPAPTVAEKPIVNATKSLENQFDDMANELWNEARYQAERPLATGFETLAEKFGLEGFNPESADEAYQMMRRVQDQIDEVERVLNKYKTTNLNGTEDFERVLYNFGKEKDMGDDYIEFLRRRAQYFDL